MNVIMLILTEAIQRVRRRAETEAAAARAREQALRQGMEAREQLVEALRQKQQQLIQAAKLASIGELATGVAHEINNPLTLDQLWDYQGTSGRHSRRERAGQGHDVCDSAAADGDAMNNGRFHDG